MSKLFAAYFMISVLFCFFFPLLFVNLEFHLPVLAFAVSRSLLVGGFVPLLFLLNGWGKPSGVFVCGVFLQILSILFIPITGNEWHDVMVYTLSMIVSGLFLSVISRIRSAKNPLNIH